MKGFFKNFALELKTSLERFFTTFCLTAVLFLIGGYMVLREPRGDLLDTLTRVILTVSFGILVCTFGKILYEKYVKPVKITRILTEAGLILFSACAYPLLKGYESDPYLVMGYTGIMIALFVGIVYVVSEQGISKTFSYMFKSTVFNWLTCLIVMAGASICIFAFHSLIYSMKDVWKVYSVAFLFIWAVLFLNLSLSAIPKRGAELKIPAIFRIMVMYVALPLYLLLVTILYIYLGKILLTRSFPSGQVNWFASFASLFFVFFLFALTQYREENKFARILVKFGGYGVIPIIAVQFTAVYIRLSSYGLTTARYVSLVLNILALIFAVVSLVKSGKYVKHMLPVLMGAALIVTLTPLNAIDVPARNQSARLICVLEQNGMVKDGEIIPNGDVSNEDKIKITSGYQYLRRSDSKVVPHVIKDTFEQGFRDVLGFDGEYRYYERYVENGHLVYYTHDYDFLDISGYSKLYNKESYGNWEYDHDLAEYAAELYAEHGEDSKDVRMELQIGEDLLMLTRLHFYRDENNEITVYSYNGYLLEK